MLRKVSKLRLGVTRAHRSLTQGVQAGCEPWLAGTATRIRRSAWLILGVEPNQSGGAFRNQEQYGEGARITPISLGAHSTNRNCRS